MYFLSFLFGKKQVELIKIAGVLLRNLQGGVTEASPELYNR